MKRSSWDFRELSARFGETNVFCGDPARQVTDQHFYSGGGGMIAIKDLSTALAAEDEIGEQGEGASAFQVLDGDSDVFHPSRAAIGPYYRTHEPKISRR